MHLNISSYSLGEHVLTIYRNRPHLCFHMSLRIGEPVLMHLNISSHSLGAHVLTLYRNRPHLCLHMSLRICEPVLMNLNVCPHNVRAVEHAEVKLCLLLIQIHGK